MKCQAQTVAADKPLSVALVGCGRHARNRLIPAMLARQDEIRIAAICDTDPTVSAAPDFAFPGMQVSTDVSAVLARSDVAAAIIAAPAHSHADITRQALTSGKFVLVEKPPARSSQEWVTACQIAPENVMVAFMKRYAPAYLVVADWAEDAGADMCAFSSCFRAGPYPDLSSFLLEFGIHHLDLACSFLGRPREVSASVAPQQNPRVASVTVSFQHAVAGLSFSWCTGWTQHAEYVELVGSGWMARVDNARKVALFPTASPGPEIAATPMHMSWEPNYPISWREIKGQVLDGYANELQAFVGFCCGNPRPVPGFQNGLDALRMCEAIVQSSSSGGRPVALP